MWSPPAPLPPRAEPRALYGSRLYDRPEHAAVRARVLEFVAGDAPVVVEVGFDHGMVLLEQARVAPETRWLGLEIRKRRVAALVPHAPPNCLPFAGDARTVFHALLPPGSVDRVEIRFPTPATNPRHVLMSAGFVADLARVLRPGGTVFHMTDVEGLAALAASLLAHWSMAALPPDPPALSRRARVCRRDGLPVWQACWTVPESTAALPAPGGTLPPHRT